MKNKEKLEKLQWSLNEETWGLNIPWQPGFDSVVEKGHGEFWIKSVS